MIVYQTDINGYYVGIAQADPSPLEPGTWLIPGRAYTVAPSIPNGHYAQWVNGTWAYYVNPDPDAPEDEAPEQTLEEWRTAMVVSAFQAKAALYNIGKLELAQQVVEQAGGLVKLAWDEAVEFRRLSPSILQLAPALSLTDTDLDDLFRDAEVIVA
jgi:hypothetical protein